MNTENRAIKELLETITLTDYLMAHDMDFEDINNFSNKMVKKALAWKREKLE